MKSIRDEFPILDTATYLNSCSLGALSHRSERRLREFLDLWHQMGASAWYEHWVARLAELRTAAGEFVGGAPGTVALLPSTSAALSMVAESVDYKKRNRVVVTDLDFPTLVYQWRVKPEVEVIMLRSEDGIGIDPDQFAAVVDERTAFVATSHVYYATGHVQDVAAVADIARSAGAFSVIDAYQAPGQIPVDVTALGADFYTWGPLKWLCGGPGLSYLHVRESLIQSLEPRITSWWANRDQFGFDLERFAYRDDALRFELGTPPLPSVHLALGGQDIVSEVGIERIVDRNRELSERVRRLAASAGFELRQSTDPHRRSAIVMIRHPDPSGAVKQLATNRIIVDYRGDYVRVSPHFYNTEEDVDRCIEALARFAAAT